MASRRKEFFPEVTDEQWNDWHWQVKNRIETLDQLKKYIRLTPDEEEGIRESLKTLRMAITPYYPVSYTHLDVYKRQFQHCAGLLVYLPIQR